MADTPQKKTLEELRNEAIAELERRGYDVCGKTLAQSNASGVQWPCGGNIGGLEMGRSARLPARFPAGSKYALGSSRSICQAVRRISQWPQSRSFTAKNVALRCWELQQVSIVPNRRAVPIDAPVSKKRERVST